MRRAAAKKGLGIVDLSAATTDPSGAVRASAYVDSNHILAPVFIEAWRSQ
jgi:hypothetical protein